MNRTKIEVRINDHTTVKVEEFTAEQQKRINRGYVDTIGTESYERNIFIKIIEHLTSLLAEDEGEGWISVKDRLPEDAKHYLVYVTGYSNVTAIEKRYCDVGYFIGGFWSNKHGETYTHWQPLPKAPSQPQKGERV